MHDPHVDGGARAPRSAESIGIEPDVMGRGEVKP